MSEKYIYADIAQEREAQDAQWGGYEHDDTHTSIFDWVVYIVRHTGRAVLYTEEAPSMNILTNFRAQMVKVAALAVAAIAWSDRQISSGGLQAPAPALSGDTTPLHEGPSAQPEVGHLATTGFAPRAPRLGRDFTYLAFAWEVGALAILAVLHAAFPMDARFWWALSLIFTLLVVLSAAGNYLLIHLRYLEALDRSTL